MVLGERCNETVRNGKRSRGPSPNGHGSPDSSSEDENAEKIRVGRDYQATCPELEPLDDRKPELIADRALLVWSPTIDISDGKLDEYITVAKDKYGYNGEQALGMLFWHKHDLNRATLDLGNFTPFPDEWTVEDKVLFEQAFQFHGKSFHRIKHMLPDKSIAALVKYYYSWKKSRTRISLMDRGATVPGATSNRGGPSDGGLSLLGASDNESENDENVQLNKQQISALKRKYTEGSSGTSASTIEELRPGEPQAKVNARWHNDELLMAVQGVRKYGKDYAAIAETIGTKSEAHVRSFFATYRRRYNLDAVLREYEAEKGNAGSSTSTSANTAEAEVNGHNVPNNGSAVEDSSDTSAGAPALATPSQIKDDKMEVDSEGCPLGAPADHGGAPTTPSKSKMLAK